MQNEAVFDFLIDRLQFPELINANQANLNKQRFNAVLDANRSRPSFLPITHILPAAAENAPISESTEGVNYPVVITGAITDGQDRNVQIYLNRSRNALVGFGKESNLKLSLDAIAGHNVASAGYPGEQSFFNPLLLGEQDYLTIEMYQENTGAVETVWTVFNGVRVYPPNSAESKLSDLVEKAVKDEIANRIIPLSGFDVCKVVFDVNGRAEAETPRHDEPYLILGFRSTFTDALISVGFDSQRGFSNDPFPIWAICNEKTNQRQTFKLLKKPLFIAPNEKLKFSLINNLDGANAGVNTLYAQNGNIEVLRSSI